MNILALEGALGSFSCALLADGGEDSEQVDGRLALEEGMMPVPRLLHRAGIAPEQLDRIAVGCGPGAFTGMRIAISYAKSLAQGWRLPLVALSSFDIITGKESALPLLTVVQSRSGFISGRLRTAAGERRASGALADAIGQLLPQPEGCVTVVNPPEELLAALRERAIDVRIVTDQTSPPALSLARLARCAVPAKSLHEVRADYGELPPAKIPRLP